MINFHSYSYPSSSLEWKMEVLRMIDSLNKNEKVGKIEIGINDDNPISDEIMEWINRKYRNMYSIKIVD